MVLKPVVDLARRGFMGLSNLKAAPTGNLPATVAKVIPKATGTLSKPPLAFPEESVPVDKMTKLLTDYLSKDVSRRSALKKGASTAIGQIMPNFPVSSPLEALSQQAAPAAATIASKYPAALKLAKDFLNNYEPRTNIEDAVEIGAEYLQTTKFKDSLRILNESVPQGTTADTHPEEWGTAKSVMHGMQGKENLFEHQNNLTSPLVRYWSDEGELDNWIEGGAPVIKEALDYVQWVKKQGDNPKYTKELERLKKDYFEESEFYVEPDIEWFVDEELSLVRQLREELGAPE